jgi:hypothetical protein
LSKLFFPLHQIDGMKCLLLFALVTILVGSCSKSVEQNSPGKKDIYYQDLHDTVLDYNHDLHLDLDNNETEDFNFYVSDDDIRMKLEFRVRTLNEAMLVTAAFEPKVFETGEMLQVADNSKYGWSRNSAYLAYWNYTDSTAPVWEGAWNNHTNKFLAVKVKQSNEYYVGWIRISASPTGSKLLFHDCAVSKMPGVTIKAGTRD